MKLSVILFLILLVNTYSQTTSLTGNIINQESKLSIPFVNIGVQGTYFGTSTNEFGDFKLVLENGKHTLIFSCVGFKTQIIPITSPLNKKLRIELKPIPVELPEVIIDADENPAYSIIRKAIANKEKNKKGLLNYHYDFYSKNIFKSGKEIVFIEEDIGEGFKVLPDSVSELKTKITKTENLSDISFRNSDLNFFEKKIIDFTDDSLTLGEFVFHLPISKFAFDYYDYELLSIIQGENVNYFQIKVLPYSKIRPTFSGEILIEDSSYALTGLNLSLENRNLIPFMDFKMSIIQNLLKYKGFWFPKYYNIDVETNLNYYHLISLDSAITSFVKVFNNISINVEKEDTLLTYLNHIGDTTYNLDPELITKPTMDSLRLYPLITKELVAYEEIDSSKDIASSLKLGGIGGEYIKSNIDNDSGEGSSGSNYMKMFEYVEFGNNRVDGLVFGLKANQWVNDTLFNINSSLAYSILRKDVESNIKLFLPTSGSFIDGIKFKLNYGTEPIVTLTPYSELFNSISVTLGFEDQFNYYFSRGISVGITKNISNITKLNFNVNVESQKSVAAEKHYKIFNSNIALRDNLQIVNAVDNSIDFQFIIGSSPFAFDLTTKDGFTTLVELSSGLIGSDFDYLKINLASKFFITTIFDELFFSPYLAILMEANSVFGDYGPQHLTTPHTAMGYYSPTGTFKGLSPYQLLGDKSISLHLEHNWRKTFFDMLGIYFPVAWNLELTTGISGLRIWNKSEYLNDLYEDKYYWEVYGGISGILGLLNLNVAYNKYKDTVVRFGFSRFF